MGSYRLPHGGEAGPSVTQWGGGVGLESRALVPVTSPQVPQNRWAEPGDNHTDAQEAHSVLPSPSSVRLPGHGHAHSSALLSLGLSLQERHGDQTWQVPDARSY